MRKISGQLLSSKPVSLDWAAKTVTDFASFDNGSSATVSLYLQRTADAFNDLLQFHSKRSKHADSGNGRRRKKTQTSESDGLGENSGEKSVFSRRKARTSESDGLGEISGEKSVFSRKKARTSESVGLGENSGEKSVEGLKIRGGKGNESVNRPNPNEDEVNASAKEQRKAEKKKKKKKKVKNGGDEGLDA